MKRKLKTTMAEIENGSMISIFSIKSKYFSTTDQSSFRYMYEQ